MQMEDSQFGQTQISAPATMKFKASIYDSSKRKIGSVTFPTWKQAAEKLRNDKTPGRKFSGITIEL